MSGNSDFQRLQRLLFGAEPEELKRLRERLENPERRAEDIADVLTEALQKTPDREHLSRVIAEPATEAIRISIQRDSEHVAGILYPAVLPSIRKSIEQTIQGFMESIDLLIKQQFSLDALKWRFESLRTGVPFHEIMLRHTLRYQVEQVFLIHRHSGLLIGHISFAEGEGKDQDAVSGMLSAIESFVRESFGADDDDHLERVTVGDRIVYLEHGPQALLASVVRGVATPAYCRKLTEVNEDIHAAFGPQLKNFSGDPDALPGLDALLKQAIGREFQLPGKEKKKYASKSKLRLLLTGGAIVLVLLAGYLAYHYWQAGRVERLMAALTDRPGIVATQRLQSDGGWRIDGLQDADAISPDDLLTRFGLDDDVDLHFEPYLSLAPEVVVRRARRVLHIPAAMAARLEGKTLVLAGEAPIEWLLSARQENLPLPMGVERLDLSNVRPEPGSMEKMLSSLLPGLPDGAITRGDNGTVEVMLEKALTPPQAEALARLSRILVPYLTVTIR